MDRYDERGLEWAATHARAGRRDEAAVLRPPGGPAGLRLDVGCGAGRYLPHLGTPAIALDASAVMLEACRAAGARRALRPGRCRAPALCPPVARRRLVVDDPPPRPRHRLPLALWDLHRTLAVGAPLELQVLDGEYEGSDLPGDDVGGRFFAGWTADRLVDQVVGAGFEVEEGSLAVSGDEVGLRAVRGRTLADTVGDDMRLLVCGINASFYSADAGVGYARPGNRFWPAALGAGIVDRDRDPVDALVGHGMGMTDFVKRATRTAAEVTVAEYRRGYARVERLVEWLRPGAVCFVGLSGWRAVVDPRAVAGPQDVGPSAVGRPTSCPRPAASTPGRRSTSSPSIWLPPAPWPTRPRARVGTAPRPRAGPADPNRTDPKGRSARHPVG